YGLAAGNQRRDDRGDRHRGHDPDAARERAHDLLGDVLGRDDRAQPHAGDRRVEQHRQRGARVGHHQRVDGRTDVVPADPQARAGSPSVGYSAMNMITPEPRMATSNGFSPARIAGSTNSTSTAKLSPSAPSAASPCHRPSTTTAIANSAASAASGSPRWKSTS